MTGLGCIKAFGIEGMGLYDAGLPQDLQAKGHSPLDVMRPNRQRRCLPGKSDSLDGESAARSVLNGQATALVRTMGGTSQMISHIKTVRDDAVKPRSQAMIPLKPLIPNAPAKRHTRLDQIRGPITLLRHIAAPRSGKITFATAAAKTAMPARARHRRLLPAEIQVHDQELQRRVCDKAPDLMKSYAISTLTVAEMRLLVAENPDRIRSEAALARLCGVCPIPGSSGKTNRMRLNRGGTRQANAAHDRVAIDRMRGDAKTKADAPRRTAEGKRCERSHAATRDRLRAIGCVRDIHRTLPTWIATKRRLTNTTAAIRVVGTDFKTFKAAMIWWTPGNPSSSRDGRQPIHQQIT